jgi:DnaJ like chaperone protein
VSIVGRALGGAIGALLGGPAGVLVGLFAGTRFDHRTRQRQLLDACAQLLGRLYACDGRVSAAEVEAAEALFDRLAAEPEARRLAVESFEAGRHGGDPAPLLDWLGKALKPQSDTALAFLDVLLTAAWAEGEVKTEPRALLMRVGAALGFQSAYVDTRLQVLKPRSLPPPAELREARARLGVDATATAAEIRAAWRRRVQQAHPDRLQGAGADAGQIADAQAELVALNQACAVLLAAVEG